MSEEKKKVWWVWNHSQWDCNYSRVDKHYPECNTYGWLPCFECKPHYWVESVEKPAHDPDKGLDNYHNQVKITVDCHGGCGRRKDVPSGCLFLCDVCGEEMARYPLNTPVKTSEPQRADSAKGDGMEADEGAGQCNGPKAFHKPALTQNPMRFRGHMRGCNAWRWENYNRCSCWRWLNDYRDGHDCMSADYDACKYTTKDIENKFVDPFIPRFDSDLD
jgi:hypothetical protein